MDEKQLRDFNANHKEVYGNSPNHFLCPITLRDDVGANLCDGHILCAAIKGVHRDTVIQRVDVDSFFGGVVEPDLVNFLNLPMLSAEEMVASAGRYTIKLPSGEETEVFHSGPAAAAKFQQIGLVRQDGTSFSFPFLRDARIEGFVKDMEVSALIKFDNWFLMAGMIKAAYLALFNLLGYRWVDSIPGDKVRRALASFFDAHAPKAEASRKAQECFDDFDGCTTVLLAHNIPNLKETIRDKTVLFHFMEESDDVEDDLLFAISCIFEVNSRFIVVTLPWYDKTGHYFAAYSYYERYLKDRNLSHIGAIMEYGDGNFTFRSPPLRLGYVERPMPTEIDLK